MFEKWDRSQNKGSRLRRRWLTSTISVILALGLVCVLAVTASFAAFYYSSTESNLREYSVHGADLVSSLQDRKDQVIFDSCLEYARSFQEHAAVELQFVDVQGRVVGASHEAAEGSCPGTRDVAEALSTRGVTTDVGNDASIDCRVMAVSSPVIYASGEVAGVLRYVTSTRMISWSMALVGVTYRRTPATSPLE